MKRTRKGWPPNSHRYKADQRVREIDRAIASQDQRTVQCEGVVKGRAVAGGRWWPPYRCTRGATIEHGGSHFCRAHAPDEAKSAAGFNTVPPTKERQ